jgi:hypothetical protein
MFYAILQVVARLVKTGRYYNKVVVIEGADTTVTCNDSAQLMGKVAKEVLAAPHYLREMMCIKGSLNLLTKINKIGEHI